MRRAAVVLMGALALSACERTESERPTVAEAELRPDTPGSMELPPRYDAGDVVEDYDSPGGMFRIHYTRAGRHAVPAADADMDGIPDYVSLVASTYDEVQAFYAEEGFRMPPADGAVPIDNGGDARFDVYLVDFGGSSDGAYRRELCDADTGCAGYMLQENDFSGYAYPTQRYAVRLLASHEFFHAVQAAYDGELGTQGTVLAESTAVWASERFDPTLGDIEHFATYYLERTDRSLGVDPIGASVGYSYGAAILFEFLTVRHGDALVHTLWDDLRGSDSGWIPALDALLMRDHSASMAVDFPAFAEWLMFTRYRADDTRGPARGRDFDQPASESISLPYADTSIRLFPTSIRYFEAPSDSVFVRLSGADAEQIDVIAVAFSGNVFDDRASGRGTVTLRASGASAIVVALVDSRTEGMSRVLSLCIGASAAECPETGPDAGLPDAGMVGEDAGALDGGTTTAPSSSGCSCRVGHEGAPATWSLLALAALSLVSARRARSRSRR